MAYIWSLATAVPPHMIDADATRRLGRQRFGELFGNDFTPFDGIVANSRIDRRYTVRPLADIAGDHTIAQTSAWFQEAITKLGRQVLGDALARARVDAAQVDVLVTCCSTGFLIPQLDAYLVNECGLRPDVRRMPFATLGCAGGAGGIIRAAEALAARDRDATVALVCVETPSLTFRPRDQSMPNAISAVIFGDGAAAAILRGKPSPHAANVRVRGARTHLHRESYDTMGFRLADDGFQVVLASDVPEVATRGLPEVVRALCRQANATPRDLGFFALHPGGTRVLERVEQTLAIPRGATRHSWEVLRDHGNMSSPTVLFVLDRLLRDKDAHAPGDLGVLAAFGPGFAAELALLEVER